MDNGSKLSERPFFERPFLWLCCGILLFAVPVAGYLAQSGMAWDEIHPALNALLNGSSFAFLIAGWVAIRRLRDAAFHRSCMVAAFVGSTVFLGSYLARFAMSGTHKYPGTGIDKTVYLLVLFSHMLLAMVALPLILLALYRAFRGQFDRHKRIVRWTWPIWMYVSATGVIVYLMLYPIANALYR